MYFLVAVLALSGLSQDDQDPIVAYKLITRKNTLRRSSTKLELLPDGRSAFLHAGCIPRDVALVGAFRRTKKRLRLPASFSPPLKAEYIRKYVKNAEYLVPPEDEAAFDKVAVAHQEDLDEHYKGAGLKRVSKETLLKANHYFSLDGRLFQFDEKRERILRILYLSPITPESWLRLPRGKNEVATVLTFEKEGLLHIQTKKATRRVWYRVEPLPKDQ